MNFSVSYKRARGGWKARQNLMGLSQAILERHRDVELIESAADEFEDEKETHDSR